MLETEDQSLLFKAKKKEQPTCSYPTKFYYLPLVVNTNILGLLAGTTVSFTSSVDDAILADTNFCGEYWSQKDDTACDAASWLTSVIYLAAIFGALASGPLCEACGRRVSHIIGSSIFLVGYSIMLTSTTTMQILIGRAFTGVAMGGAGSVAPMYVTECLPLQHRRALGGMYGVMLNMGIWLASLLPVLLSWRQMAGVCAGTALFSMTYMATRLPDTPTYLASQAAQGRLDGDATSSPESQKVEQALRLLHGVTFHPFVSTEANLLIRSAQDANSDSRMNVYKVVGSTPGLDNSPPKLLKNLRRIQASLARIQPYTSDLIVGTGTIACFGLTAVNYICAQVGTVIEAVGGNVTVGSNCFGAAQVAVSMATLLVTPSRIKPTNVFIISAVGECASLALIGIAYALDISGLAVAGLVLYISFNAFGFGTFAFSFVSDRLPDQVRALGMSCGFVLFYGISFVYVQTSESLVDVSGASIQYLLYSMVCLGTAFWAAAFTEKRDLSGELIL